VNDAGFRTAGAGGWFSWDLKVLPDQAQELSISYRGARPAGAFDVFLDGTKLAAEQAVASGTPQRGEPSSTAYPLTPELLKGKSKITVKFQAPAAGRMGSIFSVRVVKPRVEERRSPEP
jgi:hypothetical protein